MPLDSRAARAAAAALGVVAVAVLAWILEPNAYPSYDYAFSIASAQDILAGRGTGYRVPLYAPVPHPLTLGEALAVVPLGDVAFSVFTAIALGAFGLLCLALLRLGTLLGSWPAGLLAAAAVFASPAIFELATRTYGDVAYAALVACAIALEAARPRRGWPVLAVLALAGLIRPEAWLLSGLYWLWLALALGWRDRAAYAALAAVGPVVWTAMDVALTGDPLHSVEVTRVYTEKAEATASLDEVWVAVRSLTGWPVLAGAVAGAVLAWRRQRHATVVALAAGGIAFAATVAPSLLGESPVLRRYLIVPAAVATVFFAYACLGWASRRPASRTWALAGCALLVLAVAALAGERSDRWDTHRRAQEGRQELLEHLRRWADSPVPRSYLQHAACHPVLTPGYAFRPYLRYWLDVPPRAVAFHFADAVPRRGTVLLPTAADGYQKLMLVDVGRATRGRVLAAPSFATEFRLVAGSARWDLYADADCRAAVARSVA